MNKRNLIILISALVIVFGVILIPKYFERFNILKQENVEDPLVVPQNAISENISLPPPPATSTATNTIKLPRPLSPLEQQKAVKKITLPPPPVE